MRKVMLAAVGSCLVIGVGTWVVAQDQDSARTPKYTIKEVMKQTHGPTKLRDKVLSGDASKEEKDQLLDLYLSMIESRPEKGEPQSWMMKSGRLILATARVAVGREGALEELKVASDCKACHEVHK